MDEHTDDGMREALAPPPAGEVIVAQAADESQRQEMGLGHPGEGRTRGGEGGGSGVKLAGAMEPWRRAGGARRSSSGGARFRTR